MNNKLLVGLITGGAIASTVASVYAFSSNNVDSVKSALANNDYSAWQTAITDSPNADELSTIDESTFAQLVEAYNLAQNGDTTGAREIIDSLDIRGLGMIIGGLGNGRQFGDMAPADNTQIESITSALANNDYSAWQTAITDSPNADELSAIDESTFSQLVEAYNLAQNGDFDSAKTIIDELDIHGLGMIIGMGGGHGPHGGNGGMFGQGNTAVDEALTNNDYSAWQTAIADNHNSQEMLSAINESNFSQLVEAHNLMKQARTIMDGLGLGYKGNRNNSSSNS